jgi:hypothetical protein
MKHGRGWIAVSMFFAATMATGCTPSSPAEDATDESAAAVTDAQASDSQEGASGNIEYLLVQTAPSIRYADGSLTLESVHGMTLYFADRPDRVTGWLPTTEQIADWGTGDDSFASDPPNADLSILSAADDVQVVVVLTNPRLADGDLTYDVEILEGEMPAAAGPSSLFIDVVGRPLTPVSVAGVSRRTSRRTARRVDRRN